MKRVTTGLILTVLILVLWTVQGPLMRIAMGVVAFAAVGEVVSAFEAAGKRPIKCVPLLFSALSMPVYLLIGREAMGPYMLLGIVAAMTAVVLRGEPDMDALCATALPVVYPGALFTSIYPLMDIADPYLCALALGLTFTSAFFCDMFAWAVGRTVGKRPLCPHLSPKKTVEGALGGLVGALIAAPFTVLLSGHMVRLTGRVEGAVSGPPMLALMLVAVVAGALSQCGDLSASLIKRHLNIKDYGNFLPGHGGVMDRIDSLVFSVLVIYIYFVFGMRVVIL